MTSDPRMSLMKMITVLSMGGVVKIYQALEKATSQHQTQA